MKTNRATLALTLILLGFLACESAWADPRGYRGYGGHRWHGGSARIGVVVGAPFGWGGWGYGYSGYYPPYYYTPYYAPYAYYPPAVSAPYAAPTYIEQGSPQISAAPQAAPAPQGYWYYCAESNAYYPYVNQCVGSWQRVSPTPPPGN